MVQGHVKTVLFKYAELYDNEQLDVLTTADVWSRPMLMRKGM